MSRPDSLLFALAPQRPLEPVSASPMQLAQQQPPTSIMDPAIRQAQARAAARIVPNPLWSSQEQMLPRSTDVQLHPPQYGTPPPQPNLLNIPTSQYVPDTAAEARVPVQLQPAWSPEGYVGQYRFYPDHRIDLYPEGIQTEFQGQGNLVAAHETGHSIWYNSTSPQEQEQWNAVHEQAVQPYMDDWFGKGTSLGKAQDKLLSDPSLGKRVDQKVWDNMDNPFARYWDSPSHSFADAFGKYVSDPKWLEKYYPGAYNFIKNKIGFEYSRGIGGGSIPPEILKKFNIQNKPMKNFGIQK